MPRYFFNRADGSVDRDLEGTELPNIGEVRKQAVIFAGETLKFKPEVVWSGTQFIVEVEDESGNVLFRLTVEASSP